jgi:two-component system NtrC family response regulator
VSKEKLLIIEDEASVAKQLKWSLNELYDITIAPDAQKARQLLASGVFPVATLDLGLPPDPDIPREGLQLLAEISSVAPHTKTIVITGNAEQENAVKAVSLGAVDFCAKPIDLQVLQIILTRTFRMYNLEEANRRLLQQAEQSGSLCSMLGVSPPMQKLFTLIRKVSGNDYPVLVSGESGTGKEMVAHAIHDLSARSSKPFVIINCGAIPENLLESELFGHEKGAFTGAIARKIGKFELADGGTLFLDEIGELPLALQVKILRCLQEGTIERIGGNRTLSLDVRIIAATNIDLHEAIGKGTFREDLYFRLNVVPVQLPPLRERPEDIIMLAQHFLQTEAKALKAGHVSFSPGAIVALSAHSWPGNVRELQNRIRRALSVISGQLIMPDNLGLEAEPKDKINQRLLTLQEARDQAEQRCVQQALVLTGNNISQAAKLLATSRPTLHDLIKKHRIDI